MSLKVQDERGFNQLFRAVGSARLRARRRHQWFLGEAARRNATRILEIGCGTGEAAAYVARGSQADVVGVDISDRFVSQARAAYKAANLRFEKIDLFGEEVVRLGAFDLIIGNGILHHLVLQLERILTILRGITNKDGGLAFIEPNFMNPYCAFIFGTKIGRKWALLEPDEMAFRSRRLRECMYNTGWRNVQVRTRDFLVPGMPGPLITPVLAVEPILEATTLTSWLAQSHFATADA